MTLEEVEESVGDGPQTQTDRKGMENSERLARRSV